MNWMDSITPDYQENMARIPGITTGIVKENYEKDHPGMVKVEMYLGEAGKNVTGWIPVMSTYAGSEYGNYWLPEVGQEVVIGFHFGERNYPIVLGCLWNKKNKLPKDTANDKNTVKQLTTKGGCKIVFTDEQGKEKIEITTPGKLAISIEDEKKQIKIKDEKEENTFLMDCEKGNLTLKVKKKMEVKIGENAVITLDEKSASIKSKKIELTGEQNVAVEGQNVKVSAKSNVDVAANANLSLKGNSGLKLNSSAITEVKGSIVKIN